MKKQDKRPMPEHIYLNELGNRLIWYFRPCQAQEIISDYQEYFTVGRERGVEIDTLADKLGDSRHVVQELLKENPLSKKYLYVWLGVCLTLFLFSVYCLFHFSYGILIFIVLAPSSLFILLHGRQRIQIEHKFLGNRGILPGIFLLNLLLLLTVIIVEIGMQHFIQNIEKMPIDIRGIHIGFVIDMVIVLVIGILFLMLVWLLRYTVQKSIRYFSCLVHIMGAILFMLDIRMILRSMDLTVGYGISKDILMSLVPYVMGLFTAFGFYLYMKIIWNCGDGD